MYLNYNSFKNKIIKFNIFIGNWLHFNKWINQIWMCCYDPLAIKAADMLSFVSTNQVTHVTWHDERNEYIR